MPCRRRVPTHGTVALAAEVVAGTTRRRRAGTTQGQHPPPTTILPRKPRLYHGLRGGALSQRRGGDSNSRDRCRPTGFRNRRIQPLCHLSGGSESTPRGGGRQIG